MRLISLLKARLSRQPERADITRTSTEHLVEELDRRLAIRARDRIAAREEARRREWTKFEQQLAHDPLLHPRR
jgi:hypothetical protein